MSSLLLSCQNQDINKIDNNLVQNIETASKNKFIKSQSLKPLNNGKLQPDGESTFEWTIKVIDKEGKPLKNTEISFSVEPINPLNGWRNIEEVAKRYGSSANKLRDKVNNGSIRLIGTVIPQKVQTNSEGIAKTIYKTSHIGGNEENKGSEKIIAKYNNEILENKVEIGYDDLVPIPTIDGVLKIGDATGKHLQKDVVDLLLNIADKIKAEKWTQPLTITAGTLKWGGLYPPHFTHRRGGTFDFRPMSTDGLATWCNTDGTFAPNYDRDKTLQLIKIFKNSGATEIIFNDPEGFKLGAKALAGHHNHLHISWLESESKLVNINKIVR
ncbi:MAG: hypothetical protein U0354_01405 [Candidatus Sericytochromatia bacterium]